MHAIVTITFSPCIDKSTSVPSIVPDKKLRCKTPKFDPGGGGINVARVIKRLGGNPLAVFAVGGHTGQYFTQLIKKEGIQGIPVKSVQLTRENLTVLDEGANIQYRFIMPSPPLSKNEWRLCLEAVERKKSTAYIVVSGSLPPGNHKSQFSQLSKVALKLNAKMIVDTSGDALKSAVKAGAYLIKPNLSELALLAGQDSMNISDAEKFSRKIVRESSCKIIILSLGKDGAMLISESGTYRFKAPGIRMKSTVGAGDSMLAGIVYSLSQKKSLDETLAYGIACGTAATMNPGTELCHKKDVEVLYQRIIQKK